MDNKLPLETISQILESLKDDQQTLVQLNSCSKKLYGITLPLLYKAPQFTTILRLELFAQTLNSTLGIFVRDLDLHMVADRWNYRAMSSLLQTITENTPDLELLNLDLCSQLTNKALIKITKPLHDLRILAVEECKLIGDEAIMTIVEQCPYLQRVYLPSTHITDTSLTLLGTKLILLTHVNVSRCHHISEVGVDTLLKNCKTLKHLDINECYNVVGNFDIPFANQQESEDEWEDLDDEEV